ncbi:ribosome biogenesis protein WDR12 [Cinnamomum micranthum f. kanehirae]|uniref:Ribosome biogenesis protein WDR12 homolog n=1 Tax=Cinnamomum micranthum f. kanehirae TaxID=337451 RepID=A0A3S3MNI9_9MAGN|nr:ribosome biogenesis protein WDR12 [Cinnamomum micranthum f. kanehirae]
MHHKFFLINLITGLLTFSITSLILLIAKVCYIYRRSREDYEQPSRIKPPYYSEGAELNSDCVICLPFGEERKEKDLQRRKKAEDTPPFSVMDIDGDVAEASKLVTVRFVTKLPPDLKVPFAAIAIPSNLSRMGLSEIVNMLLQNENPECQPQPFDFLIDGELVRMSLEEFLIAKGISAERILEIEYIKAVAPRKQENPYLHDDWVSAVDGSNPSFIFTGCYDSFGRIWKAGGLCTHVLEGHTDAITSVSIVNHEGVESHRGICLSTASKDRTLRLWKLDAAEPENLPMKIRAFKVLSGHTSSVQCVSAGPGDMVCSGSWDCSIKIWQTSFDAEGDVVPIKKRKVDADRALNEESQLKGGALSTLVGHTQCVSSVVWPEHETMYSASWDHSIRRWDLETGKDSLNLVCGKVVNCLDVGGESSALIAAGGSDPILRIWDPRKPGTLAPIFQFSSHSSWITACKWHKSSWFHLLSASYDGKVMLWDLRTAWPLAVIDSHKEKVLCADWWRGDSVISGGADSKLFMSSEISIQ